MIEFGKTLKAAREAKGLTIAQIAESTRIMSSLVEDLENEDFSRIVAPIYGRGFVKLYCEAVGLEPKPMVDEFMDFFTGKHEPTIRTRESGATAISTPTPPPPDPTPVEEDLVPAADKAAIFRIGLLLLAALIILSLIGCGIRALYRATSRTSPVETTEMTETTEMAEAVPTEAAPRTPQPVAPLYID